MKTNSTGFFRLILIMLLSMLFVNTNAQSVIDPNDAVVTYNAATPPTAPVHGQIGKWVRKKRLNWNTDSYKAYVYKGFPFRVKFPKSYNSTNDGKKYPVFVFYHGVGEGNGGDIYDNEFQLYHGGEFFRNSVDNGTFDGFILVGQSGGAWGGNGYPYISEIIDYLIANNKADPFAIVNNGLSGGGAACWTSANLFPTYYAAVLPMSSAELSFQSADFINKQKFTPLWNFQGALDGSPSPVTARQIRDTYLAAGANYSYTEYPNLAHGTWTTVWNEPGFWPFINAAYKANPWPLTGKAEFCAGDQITATLGLTPGFNEYQWRKDGNIIVGATSNTIVVNTLGTYDARVRRGSNWSEWSRKPVVMKMKEVTVPPVITITGLQTKVLPTLDDSITGVNLEVPAGYAEYLWQKVGSSTTLGTARIYKATSAGDYSVRVKENFGCSSEFSTPYTVVSASGPNKPSPATNLIVSTTSKTTLKLDWTDNPAPEFPETAYEIYRSLQETTGFRLISVSPANSITYNATGLNPAQKYYFKIRAVNNSGASAASNVANATTDFDGNPPTAPAGLVISTSTRSSITLSWTAATDDVGVTKYDIFINGVKSYVTSNTTFIVYNLETGTNYNFTVKARDLAGNTSPFSNQVTGQPVLKGLPYKYYTFTGNWNVLPDFNTLTPAATGVMPNVALTPRTQNDNFAFLWEGSINIPTTGTYYFRTNSDDGSRLWLGSLNGAASPYSFSGTPLVNNDGLHGGQDATSAAITLTAGVYPIAMAFFEQGGGEVMTVSWRTPSSGTSFVAVPASAFSDPLVGGGTAPAAPSNLVASAFSHRQINLTWTDNSDNETGFEIWRSTNALTGFATVGSSGENTSSYSDTTLAGNTTYYYQIRAIGSNGESPFVSNNTTSSEALWKLNNNYTDASTNNRTLAQSNNPTFDANDKKEGSHAIVLNGTNQNVSPPTAGSFMQTAYTQKTVVLWAKSANNTGNRFIYDFGANDDGLALRLDANVLYAGIAGNGTRINISTPYTFTDWRHIALVYNVNSLKLYINGVEVASNNALSFNALTTTSGAHRIGFGDATSGNAFQTTTPARFSGKLDDIGVYSKALSAADIVTLMNGGTLPQSYATTNLMPGTPAAPASLTASGNSSSSIQITWSDVSDESTYQLFRSNNNNGNYLPLVTLPANTTSYSDTGLFANAIHYYKVRATNVGGNSGFSNEDSSVTKNNLPVITSVTNKFMRFGTQLQLSIAATDPDAESLSFQVMGLPPFGSFTPTGNGSGTITFNNPSEAEQGSYGNITIQVTDQHSGVATTSFNLTVNDNYLPVIPAVSNVSIAEMQTSQINLTATDQNAANVLTWTFTGLPVFATVTYPSAGAAQIALAPGYADNGVYNVVAAVNDGNSGDATRTFTITVTDANPNKKTFINFNDGTAQAPAPWHNTNKNNPSLNDVFTNIKDETGTVTGYSMQVMTPWQNLGAASNNYGVSTGNNTGVYPDAVMLSAYFTTSGNTQNIKISGLGANRKFNFTFFGSRSGVADNRTGVYTINGSSVTLNAASNSQNTVSLNNMVSDATGALTLTLQAGAGSSYGYLNAMVIESLYYDGTAPAKPRNLAATLSSGKVQLNWLDAAYNETGYQVYRAVNQAGPYTLLNSGSMNVINQNQYLDQTILGSQTYYYTVRAINVEGNSPYSDTVSIQVPNIAPSLSAIADVNMKTQQVVNINLAATDDPSDVVTLTATNLPAFVTLTSNNGTGTLAINPGDVKGVFNNITVTATDNQGASTSRSFNLTVVDKDLTKINVNFNAVSPVGNPWNSFNGAPTAGRTISNMIDNVGTTTGVSVTLVDAWDDANNVGSVTGNNSGVFPDAVMQTAYFTASTAAKRIRISGLSIAATARYNLVIFASRSGVNDNRNTTYSYGGQTVTLNAASNTNNIVQISGVVPNASGQIEFTATRGTGSPYGYINAMVIESYTENGTLLAPENLTAAGKSKTSIQLNWTDKTTTEDGFEIYRSVSESSGYNLLTTTAPNVTSYVDASGLLKNTIYYYEVRAKKGTDTKSAYSNVAATSTLNSSVYINLNGVTDPNAGTPWNNTNNAPVEGDIYANFKDELSNPTGLNMEVIGKGFAGVNPYGMNTGNNSGVYPDNVIRSTWWLDLSNTGLLSIDGLNQGLTYSFTFFASRDGGGAGGDRTTVYKIGDKQVSLNAINNISQTVKITGVKADEDGKVLISVNAGGASPYGYIGAIVIESYLSTDLEGDGSTGTLAVTSNGAGVITATTATPDGSPVAQIARVETSRVAEQNNIRNLSAYPNPFVDDVFVEVNLDQPESRVVLSVADMTGRVVYTQGLENVPKGISKHRLSLGSRGLSKGIYMVSFRTGKTSQTFKILKR